VHLRLIDAVNIQYNTSIANTALSIDVEARRDVIRCDGAYLVNIVRHSGYFQSRTTHGVCDRRQQSGLAYCHGRLSNTYHDKCLGNIKTVSSAVNISYS
jgi:hypothetical protein